MNSTKCLCFAIEVTKTHGFGSPHRPTISTSIGLLTSARDYFHRRHYSPVAILQANIVGVRDTIYLSICNRLLWDLATTNNEIICGSQILYRSSLWHQSSNSIHFGGEKVGGRDFGLCWREDIHAQTLVTQTQPDIHAHTHTLNLFLISRSCCLN